MFKQATLTAALAALAFAGTTTASAATLLAESFSGDGSGNIIGTTPDVGSSTWTGSTGFLDNGTTTGQDKHAHLAFAPVISGHTYTLTTTFSGPGWGPADPNEQYLSIGFSVGNLNSNGSSSNGDGQTPQSSFGRIEVKSDGRYNAKTIGGTSVSEGDAGDPGTIGQTVSVVLDTTNALDYTVSFYWGATQLGSGPYSIGVQAIDNIYVGTERPTTNTDDSYLDQVTLTSTVPEPSSLALLGLGGLLIARRRRG